VIGKPGRALTVTEIVVADLAARGRRNEEIADDLDLALEDVDRAMTRIKNKLGVEAGAERIVREEIDDG
jgi:DNA-binding CsgD family transcriptional regulator